MTDHKFTDDEIIKAMKHCNLEVKGLCKDCPLRDYSSCTEIICKYALALINRQKAQIDSLLRIKALAEEIVKQTSEAQEITIREFAERLKSDLGRIPQHKFTRSQVEWSINTITDRILGGI